jgi:hypothetical protein
VLFSHSAAIRRTTSPTVIGITIIQRKAYAELVLNLVEKSVESPKAAKAVVDRPLLFRVAEKKIEEMTFVVWRPGGRTMLLE